MPHKQLLLKVVYPVYNCEVWTPTSPASSLYLFDIAQSGELLSNKSAYIIKNISPNLPQNTAEILWKPIQSSPDPPLLPYLLLSPSSASSSVHSSEGWERRINTLPPKSTLGKTDGQMQEGRKGGGGEIKGEEVWDFINPKWETWSASHTNKISMKSMMRAERSEENDGSSVMASDVI